MTVIESGDIEDVQLSKDCRIFIEITLKSNKYDIYLPDIVEDSIPNELEITTTERSRVIVRGGNRMWFKRPYLTYNRVVDGVIDVLVEQKGLSRSKAIKKGSNMVECYIYSTLDHERAELGLDIELANVSSNSVIEDRKRKYRDEGGNLLDVFNSFNIESGDRIELMGFDGTIGVKELDKGAEKMKTIFGTESIILFCQPKKDGY